MIQHCTRQIRDCFLTSWQPACSSRIRTSHDHIDLGYSVLLYSGDLRCACGAYRAHVCYYLPAWAASARRPVHCRSLLPNVTSRTVRVLYHHDYDVRRLCHLPGRAQCIRACASVPLRLLCGPVVCRHAAPALRESDCNCIAARPFLLCRPWRHCFQRPASHVRCGRISRRLPALLVLYRPLPAAEPDATNSIQLITPSPFSPLHNRTLHPKDPLLWLVTAPYHLTLNLLLAFMMIFLATCTSPIHENISNPPYSCCNAVSVQPCLKFRLFVAGLLVDPLITSCCLSTPNVSDSFMWNASGIVILIPLGPPRTGLDAFGDSQPCRIHNSAIRPWVSSGLGGYVSFVL